MTSETVLYVGDRAAYQALASSLDDDTTPVVHAPDVAAATTLLVADGGADEPSLAVSVDPADPAADSLAAVSCVVVEYGAGDLDDLLDCVSGTATSPPVLVVGPDDEATVDDALSAGATDYLPRSAAAHERRVARRVQASLANDGPDRSTERVREQFDALFSDPESANALVDRDGRVTEVNDTALAFIGANEDAVVGSLLWELPWIDRAAVDVDVVKEAVETAGDGEPTRLLVHAHDASGTFRTAEVRFRPVSRDGAVDSVLVSGRDLSELMADAGPVPESPVRRLRTIVENVPLVLFAFDADGTFTLSEGRGLERLGLEPGEVVGESIYEVYGDNPDVLDACDRALAGEHVEVTVETDARVFDAWMRSVFEAAEGDSDAESREVRSVIGAAIDVTDRAERERELQQYEAMLEAVPDGVFVIDENGVIVGGNERAAREVGFDLDDLLGTSFTQLAEAGVVEWDLIREYEAVLPELLSSEHDRDHARFEVDLYPPDGSHRIVEGHVTLLPYDEEFRGVIGVNRDITDRKRRERELQRQNERLDQFASVVSHDLRNPLNVAQGYVEILAEHLQADDTARVFTGDGDLAPAVTDALEQTEVSLDRMERLIEGLLELARKGETVTDPEPVSLAAVVDRAWKSVVSPDASLTVAADRTLSADPDRLQQLLENCFRNAVEHGGDSITVTVGLLDDEPGFFVADDGPGIPDAVRESVFDYGFSTIEAGTGFGLAIVSEIADAHGWTVSLTESDAGGACFEFRDAHSAD